MLLMRDVGAVVKITVGAELVFLLVVGKGTPVVELPGQIVVVRVATTVVTGTLPVFRVVGAVVVGTPPVGDAVKVGEHSAAGSVKVPLDALYTTQFFSHAASPLVKLDCQHNETLFPTGGSPARFCITRSALDPSLDRGILK